MIYLIDKIINLFYLKFKNLLVNRLSIFLFIIKNMAEEIEPHILKRYDIISKQGKGAYGVVY